MMEVEEGGHPQNHPFNMGFSNLKHHSAVTQPVGQSRTQRHSGMFENHKTAFYWASYRKT